eukprot:3762691-Rhodomonas_salina.2
MEMETGMPQGPVPGVPGYASGTGEAGYRERLPEKATDAGRSLPNRARGLRTRIRESTTSLYRKAFKTVDCSTRIIQVASSGRKSHRPDL